jgi:hypothetical protein
LLSRLGPKVAFEVVVRTQPEATVRKTALTLAFAALTAVAACKKTGENEFQVQTPDVDVKTDTTTIKTPDVDIVKDSTKVTVPKVDVRKDTATVAVPKVRVTKP